MPPNIVGVDAGCVRRIEVEVESHRQLAKWLLHGILLVLARTLSCTEKGMAEEALVVFLSVESATGL
jgi:hypothetical protein